MATEVDTVEPPARAGQEPSSLKLDMTLALWLTLFVFGGGLLALYYADIGYFPEVSWEDALTYLALMTIIGGSLVVAYCFLLLLPGAIWSEYLVNDKQLRPVLTMAEQPGKPCVWSIGKRIVFPFALFMAFCHSLLLLQPDAGGSQAFLAAGAAASLTAATGLMWRDVRKALESATDGSTPVGAPVREDIRVAAFHAPLLLVFFAKILYGPIPEPEFLGILALLPLAGFAIVRDRRGHLSEPWSGRHHIPPQWSLLCRVILAFGSAALVSLAALWFFHRIYSGGGSQASQAPPSLLLLCTVVVIVTNLVVCVVFRDSRRRALLASFVAALVLLGAGQLLKEAGADAGAGLPASIMKKFGFGGRTAIVVLTQKGGRLLCRNGIPVQLAEPGWPAVPPATQGPGDQSQPPENRPFARAAELEILSRLGSELVLRYGGVQGRIVAVPKSDVISWSAGSGSGPSFRSDCPP